MTDFVFGYASLVAIEDLDALPGRLRDFRRCWGVAMNNWEGGEDAKHWLDRATGERPRIRVAYLGIYERAGSAVNGLALPVDVERLAVLDEREINYQRIEVTEAFEPEVPGLVFTYIGLDAAHERCRQGIAEGNVYVSRDYAVAVRAAFGRLAPSGLPEFDRTTDPLAFRERDLQVVLPSSATGS